MYILKYSISSWFVTWDEDISLASFIPVTLSIWRGDDLVSVRVTPVLLIQRRRSLMDFGTVS